LKETGRVILVISFPIIDFRMLCEYVSHDLDFVG